MVTRTDPMSDAERLEDERIDDELEDAWDVEEEDDEVDEDPIEAAEVYDDEADEVQSRDLNDASTIALTNDPVPMD
jgi:hypothetical protein